MPLKDMTTPQLVRITGKWLGPLRPLLEGTPELGGRTLLTEVLDIIKLGKRIGDLSDQRAAIEKELALTQSADGLRREARLLWIRTVNAFLGIVEIAEITAKEKELVLAPIVKAE